MKLSDLKCGACGVTGDKAPMYRTGPKGPNTDPRWRCENCCRPTDDVKSLVDVITGCKES